MMMMSLAMIQRPGSIRKHFIPEIVLHLNFAYLIRFFFILIAGMHFFLFHFTTLTPLVTIPNSY